MTIQTSPTAGKAALDNADQNQLAALLQAIKFGHILRALPIRVCAVAPVAATVNPYVAAAAQSVILGDDAKAAIIHRAYARTGTGTAGPLTIDTPDPTGAAAAPAASHMAISPNGDFVFNAGDAWTAVDVLYTPEKFDMVEVTLAVASNTLTLPTSFNGAVTQGVLFVAEVQALTGTTVGNKIVDAPGTSPAAAHAALNLAKTTVSFNSADAVTQARVKFAVASFVDLNAFLETNSNFF